MTILASFSDQSHPSVILSFRYPMGKGERPTAQVIAIVVIVLNAANIRHAQGSEDLELEESGLYTCSTALEAIASANTRF